MKKSKMLALLLAALLLMAGCSTASIGEAEKLPAANESSDQQVPSEENPEQPAAPQQSAGEESSQPQPAAARLNTDSPYVILPTQEEFGDTDYQRLQSTLTSLAKFSANSASAAFSTKGTDQNLTFSPASFAYALGMLSTGAEGSTYSKLLSALNLENTSKEELSTRFQELYQATYQNDEISTITLANSMWLQKDFPFQQGFVDNLRDTFYAGAYEAEFGTDKTNQEMAQWISDNTGGQLNPSLKTDDQQVLALINTIYFNAAWDEPFAAEATQERDFNLFGGGTVQADFMEKTTQTQYYKGQNYIQASLPFQGGSTMHFVLPNKGISVGELASSPVVMDQILSPTQPVEAEVTFQIPKFSFDTSFNLQNTCDALGIGEVFESTADLSALSQQPTQVSSAIQQTRIYIDETGCEGAAYTMIGIEATSLELPEEQPEKVEMVLDRPFLFTVTSSQGLPLFVGIVVNPVQ